MRSTASTPIDAPARVSQAALEGRCAACVEALSMFVEAYGAEAGNLALRGVATSGVLRRRRDRAEDSAGAAGRAVHRGVPREGSVR